RNRYESVGIGLLALATPFVRSMSWNACNPPSETIRVSTSSRTTRSTIRPSTSVTCHTPASSVATASNDQANTVPACVLPSPITSDSPVVSLLQPVSQRDTPSAISANTAAPSVAAPSTLPPGALSAIACQAPSASLDQSAVSLSAHAAPLPTANASTSTRTSG